MLLQILGLCRAVSAWKKSIALNTVGGAMSVKLVSWSEPLKITPGHPDVVELNARCLSRLYHEAGVHESPVIEFEWIVMV